MEILFILSALFFLAMGYHIGTQTVKERVIYKNLVNPNWERDAMLLCIQHATKTTEEAMKQIEDKKYNNTKKVLKTLHSDLLDIKYWEK